ncbi:biotin--[acetyl-CoA-carboxylase] ligase [Candidatus Purcelliella pentastirinorum]|uniref:Biotin--[acetyl-CoA-carboxylase] ligase n=1 Tax=Candidatus Purcelliella pentastirinorum TaxID=472834 RepID=A0AAX3NA85_9ENTR|nr:biotin--[acetyl-CoA-carboxylase] ligase [Candidatus Purcelliella pentastirinorum]WDI78441.1 biotin--[acetyl-CoA-carboxylase] ligase [Candidatus Purcelliella pentastirinorum]WDR80530.1 biotin--[acetyl-CoA-carboxylase] ligase [Candidatus Purcelliella pentastirinorum]
MLNTYKFCSLNMFVNCLGLSDILVKRLIKKLKCMGVYILKFNVFDTVVYFSLNIFDFLDKIKILNKLKFNNRIFFIPIVDSTNNFLLRCINNLKIGDVCISEHQTNGRGRFNKIWFSPLIGNIYFSMFWNICDSSISITSLSVVVSKMIIDIFSKFGIMNVTLKYPNDIYLNNKKISGVLVDVVYKSNGHRKIIIGIGVNLSPIYGAFYNFHYINLKICKTFIDRNLLVSSLINHLFIVMYKSNFNKFYKLFN